MHQHHWKSLYRIITSGSSRWHMVAGRYNAPTVQSPSVKLLVVFPVSLTLPLSSSLYLHTQCPFFFFVCGLPVAGSCLDLDSHNSHSLADNPTVRESVLSCHTESFPNRSSCHVQNGFEGILGKHRSMEPAFKRRPRRWTHASSGLWSCLSSTASARDEHCDLHL